MIRLVLVGGGHSHVQVLLALARRRPGECEITMISKDVLMPYSGMLPGVVAGHYQPADALIDLAPLCAAAGAELIQAEVSRLDPTSCTVGTLSHPNVFATGDIASFATIDLPKAGVYAVRQGPLLADNLLRASKGQPLRDYRPQRHYLMLISTGERYAVAARGRWTAEGAWAWRWKDWIDRRFVQRFQLG